MTRKSAILILVLLVLIGAALRFYKFHYGLPGSYVGDTQTVSEAMDIGDSLSRADMGVFSKPVKYPLVTPYIILFLHGIYFAAGRVTGIFHSTADFLRFIALNQDVSFLIARLISVISGLLIIIFTFLSSQILAKRLGSSRPYLAAVISAVFISFSLLLFQFSRLERPHIVAGLFVLLAYFFYLRFLERPSFKNGFWVGAGVGLAAGTLQSGLLTGVFLLIPLAIYLFKKADHYKNILAGFISGAVLFFLSYPFLFFSFKKAVGLSGGKLDISFSGDTHNVFPFAGHGFYKIFHHLFLYEPALFILSLIGILVLWRRRRIKDFFRADHWALAVFFSAFLLVFGLYDFTLPRYVIPMVLVMAVLSGPLALELISGNTLDVRQRFKVAPCLFLGVLVVFSIVQAARLTFLLQFPDTRDLATAWVKTNVPASEAVLMINNALGLAPTRESILENEKLGGTISRRDKLLLSLTPSEYPPDAKTILRDWELKISDYPKFIKTNKIKYIVLSDESGFRDFNEPSPSLGSSKPGLGEPLFVFASNHFKLKMSFSPFIGKGNFLSSPFPGDFHNPITELWGIKQMGPEVRIYGVR